MCFSGINEDCADLRNFILNVPLSLVNYAYIICLYIYKYIILSNYAYFRYFLRNRNDLYKIAILFTIYEPKQPLCL